MTTQGKTPIPTELLRPGATELKLNLEQQARLLEHTRRLQHETEALEAHTRTWLKEQLKVIKSNDDQFNDLNDQLNELKVNPEFTEANNALKEIKERIGLKEVEKLRNTRNRELTAEVTQSQDSLELQTLILEKTQELLDNMLQLEATNEYIRTQGVLLLEAATNQLPIA